MTIATRARPGHCSGCDDVPCHCPAPVTVRCACGGYLTATDTLDDKRRAHVEHTRTVMHEAWRAWRRLREVLV